jgi:hypothetical protein
MATRRQIAAAKRNIRKAQAARKGKARRTHARRDNPVRRRRSTAGTTRRTTRRRRARRDNPVEILEANPTRRRTRRATRKRAVYVRRAPARGRKRQSIINVHVVAPKTRRRAAAKRRTAKRRTAKRRRAHTVRRGVAGLLPAARLDNPVLMENPTRRRRSRRKTRKAAKRRRRSGTTQTLRARRSSRLIKLVRNPLDGSMALDDNPMSFSYDDNPFDANPMHGMHGGMSRYDENPLLDNPGGGGLLDNPLGAFSGENIKKFGVAAGGVALGLIVADFVDRYVATRKPKGDGANNPWYGRDAAAAYRQKPDAMRLGVQALGAGGSMFLAYQLRNKAWAPWLFGGLALGFGVNLIKMLADWWLMPAVLSVKEADAGKMSLGNRLYPLEQSYVQEKVADIFKNWNDATKAPADLAAAQTKDNPTIVGPLSSQTPADSSGSIYALGDPNAQPRLGVAAPPATFRQ